MPDLSHMHHALMLAARGLGTTAPNPSVGCVIVRDDQVVGRGCTGAGGRPHAETIALAQAGGKAAGATLYVTLEPCSHHGQTPPCADAIVQAGIKRVVIACIDSNPKVSGNGIKLLTLANIEVETGLCEKEARALNAGFFSVMEQGVPYVALKIATSSDGKIAHPEGGPRWITGDEARRYGHMLRARHDAILTGIGTVLADDPMLDCRIAGLENRSPIRVVLDSFLRIPPTSKLVQSARDVPLWIFTTRATLQQNAEKALALRNSGVVLMGIETVGGHLSLPATLAQLAQLGITRLLVEAGAQITRAFFEAKRVDCFYWFRAPHAIGGKVPALFENIAGPQGFMHTHTRKLGEDCLDIMEHS